MPLLVNEITWQALSAICVRNLPPTGNIHWVNLFPSVWRQSISLSVNQEYNEDYRYCAKEIESAGCSPSFIVVTGMARKLI